MARRRKQVDVVVVEEALAEAIDHHHNASTVEDIDANDIAPLSFKTPLDSLKSIQDIAATAAFLGMFSVIVLGIVMREIVQTPLVWTVAVSTILYIWTILLGSGVVDRDRTHIAFDVVYEMLPAWWQFGCRVVGDLLLAVTFGMLVFPTIEYLDYMSRRTVPDLPWLSYQVAFSIFVIFAVLVVVYRTWSVVHEIVVVVRERGTQKES